MPKIEHISIPESVDVGILNQTLRGANLHKNEKRFVQLALVNCREMIRELSELERLLEAKANSM